MKVTTAEFLKNFGTLADRALAEPLTITKHGRDRFVLVGAEEWNRVVRRSKRVVPLGEFSEAAIELIQQSADQASDVELDKELEGWKP